MAVKLTVINETGQDAKSYRDRQRQIRALRFQVECPIRYSEQDTFIGHKWQAVVAGRKGSAGIGDAENRLHLATALKAEATIQVAMCLPSPNPIYPGPGISTLCLARSRRRRSTGAEEANAKTSQDEGDRHGGSGTTSGGPSPAGRGGSGGNPPPGGPPASSGGGGY